MYVERSSARAIESRAEKTPSPASSNDNAPEPAKMKPTVRVTYGPAVPDAIGSMTLDHAQADNTDITKHGHDQSTENAARRTENAQPAISAIGTYSFGGSTF
jgi:hypothetical protein